MELNSYIQPDSFVKSTVDELEQCFREINNVISSQMHMKVSFQYNSNLLMAVQMNDGNTLAERLYYLPMQDRQLQTRVIPKLLTMMPDTSAHFDEIEQMSQAFPSDLNSFWGIHFPVNREYCLRSKDECEAFILDSLWSLMNADSFSWLYPIVLPNIVVADSALIQIRNLGSSNNFAIVMEDLKKLNNYCDSWKAGAFSANELRQSTAIVTSDESETTKNNEKLRSYRLFQLNGLGSRYCYWHIKHGDYRLHYFPDESSRKIHIGYCGAHLPT